MCEGNATLQTGDIDYTVAFWVNLDLKVGDRDFVAKNGGFNNDEYIIGYELASDKFRYTVAGSKPAVYTTLLSTTLGSPATATWYLIVCWHDISTSEVYMQVNNGAIEEVIRSEPMYVGTPPFQLGFYNNAGAVLNPMAGFIDEVAFWKGRILGVPERDALWNGGMGLPFTSWT